MPKVRIEELPDNEKKDVNDFLDKYSFEKYCGACIFFDTDECPYNGEVFNLTEWKDDINCNKFFD